MNLDDLKDRLISDANTIWDRIQESAIYNNVRDRFENMTPTMQKVTVMVGALLMSLMILSIPFSHFNQSQEYVSEFETKRTTIRELLKVSRDSKDVSQLNDGMSIGVLQSRVENHLREAQILPEQIRETVINANSSKLIPKNIADGVLVVSLTKLNLHQTLDLGHAFQSFSNNVKLKDLTITANNQDSRYLDVIFKLVALSVPAMTEPASELPPERESRKKKTEKETEE